MRSLFILVVGVLPSWMFGVSLPSEREEEASSLSIEATT